MKPRTSADTRVTGLAAVLVVTALASLGTGVFWNGLSFIAKHTFGFDQVRNLLLYGLMGAVYMVGAFQAARITRFLERWLCPRSVVMWTVVLQAIACMLPIMSEAQWTLWTAAVVVTATSSVMWPIVESYLTAGRHGPAMRSAIGRFNLIWMSAMALPLFLMAPILERHGEWAIGGLGFTCLLALLPLLAFSRWPAPHDTEASVEHVPPRYAYLLRSARVLLPLSYMLTSVLMPILPYRFEQIGVEVWGETPSTATWMVVRVVALVIMWRLPFWHGRWGTLLLGAVLMAGGFATVVLAGTLPVMLAGFACIGAGLGVVYYTALYYAMSVGQAEVEAGGTHEALIGAGYAIGPFAGLAGTALGRGTTLTGGTAIVGIAWAIMAVSAVPAVMPYVAERRARREATRARSRPPARE